MTRLCPVRLSPLLVLLAPALLHAADVAGPAATKGTLDFSRDIRPILSDKCFACHGPDAGQRKAGLRLDTADGAIAALESGDRAIVPGKLDQSELVARITATDPDKVMPPKKHKKPLTPAEAARLKQWVAEGGSYKQHWSFIAPKRPAVAHVKRPEWVRNPIDAFVLARLEKEGVLPSPEADKATLLRRLSLDLIGLPPSPAEVDAFLNDNTPDAYEKQVDRLLRSPHYGERWGRIWLDAARYADSDGYEKDKPRYVWAYRDWVINSLNRDLPYDQFVIDQVAGDLVPNASQDQKVATGFLRNSMINEEGGVDPEQFRMEAMFDRMDAIGKGVLGLTIQCAQCHSHKFDPITQDDYYRMFAFLNNSHEADIPVYSPDQQRMRADLFRRIKEVEADLQHRNPDWPERMAEWERSVKGNQPDWVVVRPEVDEISTGGSKYLPIPDGSLLASGYAPTKHTVKMTVKTELKDITAIRLELLNDADLPLGGPGRSIKGTGALTEIMIDAAPADGSAKAERLKVFTATSDAEIPVAPLDPIHDDKSGKKRTIGPVAYALDGNELPTAWGHDVGPGRRNLPRKAVFSLEAPIRHEKGTILTFHLQQNHGGWNSDDNQNCNLGRFRLSITNTSKAEADPLPKAVREAIEIATEQRTAAQTAAIFGHWRTTVAVWKAENERIEALWKSHPEGTSQLVLTDREDARGTFLLERGDFLKPVRPIGPGVPGFLHPLPSGEPTNRLAFARWLVARESPTTARSLVNRAWQAFFGTGIVSTSEDLGSQAEAPSHPELLDWLAVEFMDRGWSQKVLHRLIVTSATYRQSSRLTPEGQARDPYNRLLARGSRYRVDAEVVRDIALAASGRLDATVGGPSVYPPAPDFLFQPPTSYGPKVWKAVGSDDRRRAVYTFRYRSVPYPALQAFDAPNGDFSCVRRARSNTPLQALTTLNEPVFLDCARALAMRTVKEGGDSDDARAAYAFRLCLGRVPTETELKVVVGLLKKQSERFAKPDAKPWDLAAADPAKPPALPKGTTPAQLAAWTAVGRVLLNLDETITKE